MVPERLFKKLSSASFPISFVLFSYELNFFSPFFSAEKKDPVRVSNNMSMFRFLSKQHGLIPSNLFDKDMKVSFMTESTMQPPRAFIKKQGSRPLKFEAIKRQLYGCTSYPSWKGEYFEYCAVRIQDVTVSPESRCYHSYLTQAF